MPNRTRNFQHIQDCVENMIQSIPAHGKLDLQPKFFELTFNTTMFLLFGHTASSGEWEELSSQESTFAGAFNVAQGYLNYLYLARRGRLRLTAWLLDNKVFRKACRTCHTFIDSAVKEALAKLPSPEKTHESPDESSYVFVEAAAQQTRDPKVIRDQCLNLLLAGRDTTACCLTWCLYVIDRESVMRAPKPANNGPGGSLLVTRESWRDFEER